ncbi:sugar transferase [Photobacterium atrarenae]|uniref:Sugar transferase n=1 Tax=Photobacterium atrarenae TaxID=865757 RepID=A0ABY5GC11_9GAMM|nr:sugar transferase [Photobacterium atrarenae]UTV26736.1 sugar transferase [Photobacterium atrarenae]
MAWVWGTFFLLAGLIAYHHLLYLPVMILLSRWRSRQGHSETAAAPPSADGDWPQVALVMCAYNESDYIEAKLANLISLDYPAGKLHLYIACDGCADDTADKIRHWQPKLDVARIRLTLIDAPDNRGKLYRLNQLMTRVRDAEGAAPFTALTDISALISIDALKQSVTAFADPKVGALTSQYLLASPQPGEAQYWAWQNQIRRSESALGNVMGGSGAFYIMRTALFHPLPADTINDDFMLPMSIIAQGYQVQLNQKINSVEIAPTSDPQDQRRRERIGAGNLQQLIRCRFLLRPSLLSSAWLFFSGKGLRTLMPFILILFLLLSVVLTATGSPFAAVMLAGQLLGYGLAMLPNIGLRNGVLVKLNYLVRGYLASLLGMLAYLRGQYRQGWQPSSALHQYQSLATRVFKRTSDVLLSIIGLLLTLPLWPLIALAIKLETPGPVFFRQLRVGQIHHHRVELFHMIKFRSMGQYAEQETGAVWATRRDPRVTRVGKFLRKTRLDELPQFINVIKGDMALIGPRPERPEFCGGLQNALPFYAERTAGLKPGITGLAQVNNGYDESLDDVKNKLLWDHAYSTALSSPFQWLRMDVHIIGKTLWIMVAGRGQ